MHDELKSSKLLFVYYVAIAVRSTLYFHMQASTGWMNTQVTFLSLFLLVYYFSQQAVVVVVVVVCLRCHDREAGNWGRCRMQKSAVFRSFPRHHIDRTGFMHATTTQGEIN